MNDSNEIRFNMKIGPNDRHALWLLDEERWGEEEENGPLSLVPSIRQPQMTNVTCTAPPMGKCVRNCPLCGQISSGATRTAVCITMPTTPGGPNRATPEWNVQMVRLPISTNLNKIANGARSTCVEYFMNSRDCSLKIPRTPKKKNLKKTKIFFWGFKIRIWEQTNPRIPCLKPFFIFKTLVCQQKFRKIQKKSEKI